jgi:aconitate hydratase
VIEIDLSKLEPHINGPFTPDLAWPLSKFAAAVKKYNYPAKLEVGLIGSCTNSSYEDLTRAASIARQAKEKNLDVQSEFTITPGSEQIRFTAERDGILRDFSEIGGLVLANACGPCIGQWSRHMDDLKRPNSIMTSFNRNFTGRNDGNPNTHAFVASPEIVTAFAIAGDLRFNPKKGTLVNKNGETVKLDPPKGIELPKAGFAVEDAGYVAPAKGGVKVVVDKKSDRLQLLKPFTPITNTELQDMRVLIKAKGKCTTDHISMAGPWLKYRGHLENISNNCYIGATNFFNDERNKVYNVEKASTWKCPLRHATTRKKASERLSSAKKTSAKAPAANTPPWNPASSASRRW